MESTDKQEDTSCYGPLEYLIGVWESDGNTGKNRAPSPRRDAENTLFRQRMEFTPIGAVANHEQVLYGLRYSTMAWEEGDDEAFHEEVGYWLWDPAEKQVMKSFIVPRGVSVNAGGTTDPEATSFEVYAEVGSETYGICSNKFLDREFKTVSYLTKLHQIDKDSFSYDENTRLKIKGQESIFDHIEKNVMKRTAIK